MGKLLNSIQQTQRLVQEGVGEAFNEHHLASKQQQIEFIVANLDKLADDEVEYIYNHIEAKVAMLEALDPVGQETADIDNDGDVDNSDDYLNNRRDVVSQAIADEE